MAAPNPRQWPVALAGIALLLVPTNVGVWVAGAGHQHDWLCLALTGAQTLAGIGSSAGLLLEWLQSSTVGRRAGLLAGVLLCSALALAGLLELGIVYLGSLDTAGVGARFN